MAREDRFTRHDELTSRSRNRGPREPLGDLDDDGLHVIDLEPEEESPFLRGQKRVPVRRGPLPKKAAHRLKQAALLAAVLLVMGFTVASAYRYGSRSWRFRLDSSENLEVSGTENVSRRQVLHAVAVDIGRNIFSVPLAARQRQLQEIPWVQSASVMRLLPDRLKVHIEERTPVAFVRIGSKISLIDSSGVVMELPTAKARKYSFPVITGMATAEPLSTRAARMKIYTALVRQLDSEGARYSEDLSEVDLSDPEDVKVVVAGPQGAVLLHLGSSDYLARYRTYLAHVQEWRQQLQKLESVDLRYDRQIIVNPDRAPVPATPQAVGGKAVPPASRQTKRAASRKPAVAARRPSPRNKSNRTDLR